MQGESIKKKSDVKKFTTFIFFDEKKYLRDIGKVSNIDFQSEIKNCARRVQKDKI